MVELSRVELIDIHAVFFVGLFLAWEVNGEIPDIDAEPSPANTKNGTAQAAQEKLIRARMRENLLAKNPKTTAAEREQIKTVKIDRSLRRYFYKQFATFSVKHVLFVKPRVSSSPI